MIVEDVKKRYLEAVDQVVSDSKKKRNIVSTIYLKKLNE